MCTDILIRIAKILMLHESSINQLGFYRGKIGIILFFFHLSRYTSKRIYEEFACVLLDELYEDINSLHDKLLSNQEYAEIGWGLSYILHQQFVEGNPDDILTPIDKILLHSPHYKKEECNTIMHYFISRSMHQTSTNYNEIIYNKCMQVCKGAKEPKLLNHQGISNGYKLLLDNAIQNIKFEYCSIFTPRPLCIVDNGYAGIGLRLILKK